MTPADIIRRWILCRCTYSRAPTGPCECTEADIRRAERESTATTKRWDERLWRERGRVS